MALLPSFFMLKSGGRYLSVTENNPANLPSGFLKFDEEQIWSPRAKFAAEPAETGDGRRLFHIRSVYNNKYLVTKQIDESNSWIVASAKKPEEDKSKASCTLFEPHSLADDDQTTTTVRLRHVGTGISATHSLSPDDDTHQGVLLSSIGSSFILTDSKSVPVLPSQIVFKSEDQNGNYLASISLYDNLIYQKFQSGVDGLDQKVIKDLLPTADGKYRIKDSYDNSAGNFWRRRDNWIKAERDDQTIDTLFSFDHIKDSVFALRNLGNNAFCGAYTESESINCLCAIYPTMSKQTRLILEEPVVERKITDLVYRLSDARIYDEKVQELNRQSGINRTTQNAATTLSFSATISRTTSWTNSVSVKVGVSVEFDTNVIPFIEESKVTLTAEGGYTYDWGGSATTELKSEASYTATVPPSKKVEVTMYATTGVCDVPFSYTQRDQLPSGEVRIYRKDDGHFIGSNSYNIRYESVEFPLYDTK